MQTLLLTCSSQGFSCLQCHPARSAEITQPAAHAICVGCGNQNSACQAGAASTSPHHVISLAPWKLSKNTASKVKEPKNSGLTDTERKSEGKGNECLPCDSSFSFSGHCHRYKAERTEGSKLHLLCLTLFGKQLSGTLSKNNTPSADQREENYKDFYSNERSHHNAH